MTDIFILVYWSFDEKSQRVHLCAGLTAASWNHLEKLALILLYNFHREHNLLEISNKKVIAENQCEKQEFSSHKPGQLIGDTGNE